jgi:hypothetical protein
LLLTAPPKSSLLRPLTALNSCSICPPYNISARTVQKTLCIVVLQSLPWEHDCLPSCYSAKAVYICLLRICCLGNVVSLFRGRYPVMGLQATLLPPYGYSSRTAYRHTIISSLPRAELVTPVIGLTFLPRGSVLTVITLQLLPP